MIFQVIEVLPENEVSVSTEAVTQFAVSVSNVVTIIDSFGDMVVTPPGTTGNVTVNARKFSVNFGPGDSSITVTNSFVTNTSNIQCTITTLDDNLRSIAVNRGVGSFMIVGDLASNGVTRIDCLVI